MLVDLSSPTPARTPDARAEAVESAPDRADFQPAPPPVRRPPVPARALIVSLHDVSPHTFETTRAMVERLEALGLSRFSLLVVPDHHRKGHFLDDPAFCHWLREREAKGDEVVIHGFYHLRASRKGESLRDRLTTRFYTAGEGEFYDMSGAEALWLIAEAREGFRKIGLDPRGFIAPAWLLSEGAEAALTKLGFAYTVRLGTITDLACQRTFASQSLVWSVRSLWRRSASRFWNRSLFNRLRPAGLLRIGLHPVDFDHRAVWRQIESLAQSALADRTPLPYGQWVENSRSFPGEGVLTR